MPAPHNFRSVLCNSAGISYVLTRKNVKNINLRIQTDGSVCVSAHPRVPQERIDAFVASKASYLLKSIEKLRRLACCQAEKHFSPEECRALFEAIAAEFSPQFAALGIPPPRIKIREMKTRWGSCTPSKGSITLNSALLGYPRACIEYVVLHEFCHFLQPNHSKSFYALVSARMPDWKERKQLLNCPR